MWYGINVKSNNFIVDSFTKPETLQKVSRLERKYKYVARSKKEVMNILLFAVLDHSKATAELMQSCKSILLNIKDDE